VDTRVARLYLMSDVLFNSQQPGVKNAFRYRDAIESMAPEIFISLGQYGKGSAGRMTMNKLRNAVHSVLSAWSNWSVYNHVFLEKLQACFDGKLTLDTFGKDQVVTKLREDLETYIPTDEKVETREESENKIEDSDSNNIRHEEAISMNEALNDDPRISFQEDNASVLSDVDGEAILDDDFETKNLDNPEQNDSFSSDHDGEELVDSDLDGELLYELDVAGGSV